MPMRIEDQAIWLEGHCTIEEAQDLYDNVRGLEDPVFNLAGVETLHTAIVQILLASKGAVVGAKPDTWLANCFRGQIRN
jgi:hypothetical protein